MVRAEGVSKISLLMVCIPAAIIPCIASLFYFKWYSDSPAAQSLYFGTKVFTVLWPLCAYFLYRGSLQTLRKDIGDAMAPELRGKAALYGLLSGLLIALTIVGAYFASDLGVVVRENSNLIKSKAVELGFLDNYILFAAFLSVLHSFIEEVYWRWCVYGSLRYLLHPGVAMCLAGFFFASHHFVVLTEYVPTDIALLCAFFVGVGGIIWSWLYQRHKSLLGAWISHMVVDVAIMYVGYLVLF